MKKFLFFLYAVAAIFVFNACDDNTDVIGSTVVPGNDEISINTKTYYANSKSIVANDSILASTGNVYLGRFTDPETNTVFAADFIAQFNCVEDYGFPEEGVVGDSALKIELKLFYDSFFGDSLNTMKCEVYELDNTLQEGIPYYTNIDPAEFYDDTKEPIATKAYSIVDKTVPDSIKYGSDYTPSITIPLPNKIGQRFIDKYYETDADGEHTGKNNFANSEAFINNVFKGVYVKCTQGDGTVVYVSMARLNVHFQYYVESSTGVKDSLSTGIATFSSTQEVLQVNKFENKLGYGHASESFKEFIEADNSCTHLRTPAGIFTEVTLPIEEIIEESDTLNSVKITFTRYNEDESLYSVPKRLLMVRKSEMYSFFLNNKVTDNVTSFHTTFNSSSNKYTFNNIAKLINYCAKEREEGLTKDAAWDDKNPDWNKVVLIPITATTNSLSNVISISHDLSMTSARLKGGENDPIAIKVVTSKFSNE